MKDGPWVQGAVGWEAGGSPQLNMLPVRSVSSRTTLPPPGSHYHPNCMLPAQSTGPSCVMVCCHYTATARQSQQCSSIGDVPCRMLAYRRATTHQEAAVRADWWNSVAGALHRAVVLCCAVRGWIDHHRREWTSRHL